MVIVLALLVLPACDGESGATQTPSPGPSGSPDPSASSTVTPSATPTPTPSRTPAPTLPPEAKGLTVESADAFMKFYMQLLSHGSATGEVAPLTTWSDKGCRGCKELIQDYRAVYAAGGSFVGDFVYKNAKSTSVRLNKVKAARVDLTATVGQHSVREKRNANPISYKGQTVRWTLTLLARNGQWIAYELKDEE